MFQLPTPTAATLKSITPRQEHHGDNTVVAISMRLEIEGANTLLDALSPALRHALYMAAPDQEELPGVEPATPLLRFDAFESHSLKACYEGWTLKVDHGIDEGDPIALGGSKVDAFRLQAKQGGTVVLSFRVGSNDVSTEEIGALCGKLGSEISITLHAPEKQPDAIDGTTEAFERDHPPEPDAGELFAREHGGGEPGPEDDSGDEDEGGIDAQPVTLSDDTEAVLITRGQRTERGRRKTREALEAGMRAAER